MTQRSIWLARRRLQWPPCRHCQKPANASRGLCYRCHRDHDIRALYVPIRNTHPVLCEPEEPDEPARRPGDAHYRCLWCGLWCCARPLQKCGACQAEYLAQAATMPEYLSED